MKKCFILFLLFVATLTTMSKETATEVQKHAEVTEKTPDLVKLADNL